MLTIFRLLLCLLAAEAVQAFTLKKKIVTIHSLNLTGLEYFKAHEDFPLTFRSAKYLKPYSDSENNWIVDAAQNSSDLAITMYDYGVGIEREYLPLTTCLLFFQMNDKDSTIRTRYSSWDQGLRSERFRINCTEETSHKVDTFLLYRTLNQTVNLNYSVVEDQSFKVDHFFRLSSFEPNKSWSGMKFNTTQAGEDLGFSYQEFYPDYERNTIVFPCFAGSPGYLSFTFNKEALPFEVCSATTSTFFENSFGNLTGSPFIPETGTPLKIRSSVEYMRLYPPGADISSDPAYVIKFTNFKISSGSTFQLGQTLGGRKFSFSTEQLWEKSVYIMQEEVDNGDYLLSMTVDNEAVDEWPLYLVHIIKNRLFNHELSFVNDKFTASFIIYPFKAYGRAEFGPEELKFSSMSSSSLVNEKTKLARRFHHPISLYGGLYQRVGEDSVMQCYYDFCFTSLEFFDEQGFFLAWVFPFIGPLNNKFDGDSAKLVIPKYNVTRRYDFSFLYVSQTEFLPNVSYWIDYREGASTRQHSLSFEDLSEYNDLDSRKILCSDARITAIWDGGCWATSVNCSVELEIIFEFTQRVKHYTLPGFEAMVEESKAQAGDCDKMLQERLFDDAVASFEPTDPSNNDSSDSDPSLIEIFMSIFTSPGGFLGALVKWFKKRIAELFGFIKTMF